MNEVPARSDTRRRPRVGLALGSGSARGWSHVGVIRALEDAGIRPDVVCGSSVGALIGAVYAAGELDRFEQWIRGLRWRSVLALLDMKIDGGLIEGSRLVEFFRRHFADPGIEGLALPFGCVATNLATGAEVWLRDGAVIESVRASAALPGLLTPVARDGALLVDGGLVNPVPVSLCRAMGAEVVIAVDLNWSLMRRHAQRAPEAAQEPAHGLVDELLQRMRARAPRTARKLPSLLDVLLTSLNIMQVRITNSRLAGEPADIVVRPDLSDFGLMDFHRAAAAIAEGERAAARVLPSLHELLR